MSSVQSLREFISERLTAAAEEIFTEFEKTIVQYEEEIDRQRRLLEISWKPQINLHRIQLPQQNIWKEEENLTNQKLCNQERNSTLDQEEPERPQQEPERPQQEPERPQQEPERPQQEPERPHINEEDLCIRQDEEQEMEKFLVAPDYKEKNYRKPEPNMDLSLPQSPPEAKNHDQKGGWNEDAGCNSNKKPKQTTRSSQSRNHKDSLDISEEKRHTDSPAGRKSFSCQTCGKSYGHRKTLKIHMRTHTGERPFTCPTCKKSFSDRKTLTSHMRVHTGDKPFPCKICGKHFSQRGNLMIHIRSHAGVKPFVCETCGNSFITRVVLNKHIRTHTGERPFSCQTCGRSFTQNSNLSRHMRTHRS